MGPRLPHALARAPALSFRNKLSIMTAMLVSQIVAHAYMTYETIMAIRGEENFGPVAGLHAAVFVYFLYRFASSCTTSTPKTSS